MIFKHFKVLLSLQMSINRLSTRQRPIYLRYYVIIKSRKPHKELGFRGNKTVDLLTLFRLQQRAPFPRAHKIDHPHHGLFATKIVCDFFCAL